MSDVTQPAPPVTARIAASGEDADAIAAELLWLHLRHWRTSLCGAALVTGLVAWSFGSQQPGALLWVWLAWGWAACVGLAIQCHRLAARGPGSLPGLRWTRVTATFSTATGLLWGSLPWCLPAAASNALIGASLVSGAVLAGGMSASGTRQTLWGMGLPIAALMPAALVWHAQLPWAGAMALLYGLTMLRYGWTLQRSILAAIGQRRRAEFLFDELTRQQEKLRAIERAQTVADERQRLMRELHDGLGSVLTSSLAVVRRGEMPPTDLAEMLRECIDELRVVIDSLDVAELELSTLLAGLRLRLGRRLEQAGIGLDWAMEDLPPLTWMGPQEALHLMRIVQELFTNVHKHAQARRISLSARRTGTHIEIRILDDGRGVEPGPGSGGRGLRMMADRAHALGGRWSIGRHAGGGTEATLLLPIERPPR